MGVYVKDINSCVVRVSLGVKASFEKNLHYNPLRTHGDDTAFSIDKDGVYIYQSNMNNYVRQFDHEGNYLRTLYPFSADKLKKIKNLKMRSVPDGDSVPDKVRGFGMGERTVSLLSIKSEQYKGAVYAMGDMVLRKGLLHLFSNQGVCYIGTDGTTRGRSFYGPENIIGQKKHKNMRKVLPHKVTVSPDGKWYYMTQYYWSSQNGQGSLIRYTGLPHFVTRMPTDGSRGPEIFLGAYKMGESNTQFDLPSGLSVDSKGRIYVTDWGNDRVQVFSPDGKFYTSIGPITGPIEINIDPKNDEIYVSTWQLRSKYVGASSPGAKAFNKRCRPELLHFSALGTKRKSKVLNRWSLEIKKKGIKVKKSRKRKGASDLVYNLSGYAPRVKVDFYSKPLRVWLYSQKDTRTDLIYLLELQKNQLVIKRNFSTEVIKSGYTNQVPFFQRRYLHYDPVREKLYVGEMDINSGKNYQNVIEIDVENNSIKNRRLNRPIADAGFDAQGQFYNRAGSTISRYKGVGLDEIPYDYGEEKYKHASLLSTIGGGASSHKYGSFGVSPQGDVVVACKWKGADINRASVEKTVSKSKKWTPEVYPGRPGSLFVHVYDKYGNLKQEDIIKGGGVFNGGLQMDLKGNVYAVIRQTRILDGKPYGNSGTGTLAKFSPGKGRLITSMKNSAIVPLNDSKPDRQKDVSKGWIEGAEWLYGEASTGNNTTCWCRHAQFYVDYYGRVFVSEQQRFTIAVLDPNGRVITRIGGYGNVDDKGIGLFDAQYLQGHTDKRLFIADNGNGRVFSATLDYHKSVKVSLKRIAGTKK
ncbi:MAG: hypothetical protein COA79_12700 [Planctomycetota bacterium]|nr:MAG: hypothetical protein COA79_12700 [Planctomycetota bacterium]